MGIRGATAAAALVATAAIAVCAPVAAYAGPTTATVAHRAGAGTAAEQTVAAVDRAVALRPAHIEVDVQLSRDGVPVLVHDRTFARTTDVEEVFPDRADDPVGSFSYREIRRLDAGSWFGDDFAGQRIPSLASLSDHLDGTGVGLYLELKNPDASPGLEAAVDAVVDADPRWRDIAVTYMSFDAAAVRRLAKLRPDDRLLWINPDVPSAAELRRLAGWVDELGVDYRRMDDADVQRVHDTGLRLAVYTVNTVADLTRLTSAGVDSLITDHPEYVLKS